jgi:hypothetical protein
MISKPWDAIFEQYRLGEHDFDSKPYIITAKQIKVATENFSLTTEREVRILCKQDYRDSRPDVFINKGLFLLPTKNGVYAIIKGEGYVDIPPIASAATEYKSKLQFELDTARVGDSEMQHLDFAYATSLVRTFLSDESLVLTIRGRKYTPKFAFKVGAHQIEVEGVQTEVDAGYEGECQVALVEAKSARAKDIIIRQLYYPYRKWSLHTEKSIVPVFFEKQDQYYDLWQFKFTNENDYNSIELVKSKRYAISP